MRDAGENPMTSEQGCIVCANPAFEHRTAEYRRCTACGHEVLERTQAQGFIVNDPLEEADARRLTMLDRFKLKVLAAIEGSRPRELLLDIGSASGKFLLQNAARYPRRLGIEVTPDALAFSRNVMGLEVVESIDEVPEGVSAATAWHSLEHVPAAELFRLMEGLAARLSPDGRFLVCVPNGASRQYRWFGSAYAFFDVPNHLHQFTLASMNLLMKRFRLVPVATFRSWQYNVFGYLQGFLNVITGTHNYFYYRMKRHSIPPSAWLDLASFALIPMILPVACLLALWDSFDSEQEGVITLCFKKQAG